MALKKMINAILALTAAGSIACGAEKIECEKYNSTTIILNQEANGIIDNPQGLIEEASVGSLPPSLIDLVNESHAQSSFPLPEGIYNTFVLNECGERSNGNALAFSVVESNEEKQRGVYLLNERMFPKDLAIVYHELGHFQKCGASEIGESVAILNHIEQTAMSFGLLYGTLLNDESIIDKVGYARPFYQESTLDLQRMIQLQSSYAFGLIYTLDQLAKNDGDFSKVRESFIPSWNSAPAEGEEQTKCKTLQELGIELRLEYQDTYDLLLSTEFEADQIDRSLVALRTIWPKLQEAYQKVANPITQKFGKSAGEAWSDYVETLTFPEIELLKGGR